MATTNKNIVQCKRVENAQTTQYTATLCRTIIDNFTVTNTTAGNVSFSCNLVPAGGTATDANLILKAVSIAPNETYPCPEIVGKVIEPNSFLSTLASAATSLTMDVSGREITS